ncbi:DHA2 family efflux MFS transporter permease subunit [Modestobacter sp. I12A-02628]|uniref:MFS transporter n=1 Tax=Goekera deserti TaxID=2497753 RepID=A0A7K3WE70_9ACTN|nr:MFS transporter [Goekera deserti]MPQ99709.1 DHA2 family efflux MFS transporter permease subunit [Goekera deserti]NDI46280.1 DHA2 family efflux MFS transporter permease subunit [Goekera deserti]NEL54788.1 MFS transporter [Goekera deserti]
MTSTDAARDERAPSAGPPVDTAQDAAHRRRWLVLALASLAQLVVVLDATIVNIALPTAQADIGFSDDSRQWVVTGYALAFGSLLLVGGRLGDLVGRRRTFVIGLIGFGAASALGGVAESFEVLVAARALQGVFGALLAPAALSLLTTTFTDPAERGRAFAVFGAISGAGGALGLILGGALTEYLSWRWCLLVNVPIVLVVVAGALAWISPRNTGTTSAATGLDVPGSVLSVAGLVGVVFGLASAETEGWSSAVTIAPIVVGLLLLAAFVVVERRVAHPLLPLRIVVDRARGGALVNLAVMGVGMFGVFLFLTYYLSTVLAYQPLEVGFAFLPMIGGIVVAAQVAPVALARIGLKLTVTAGMVVAGAGMLLLTRLGLDSSYAADILPALVVVGVGIAFVIVPSISAATAGVDGDDAGVASAMTNTSQQIGGSIGTAVLSWVAASAVDDALVGSDPADPLAGLSAAVQGYTAAFGWAAGVFFAGAVVAALLLPMRARQVDPDAAPVLVH